MKYLYLLTVSSLAFLSPTLEGSVMISSVYGSEPQTTEESKAAEPKSRADYDALVIKLYKEGKQEEGRRLNTEKIQRFSTFFDAVRLKDKKLLYKAIRQEPIEKLEETSRVGLMNIAINWDDEEVIQALSNAGLNFHLYSVNNRQSALHWAAKNNRINAFKALLKLGLDPNQKDDDGKTALDLASVELKNTLKLRPLSEIALEQWQKKLNAGEVTKEELSSKLPQDLLNKLHFPEEKIEYWQKKIDSGELTKKSLEGKIPVGIYKKLTFSRAEVINFPENKKTISLLQKLINAGKETKESLKKKYPRLPEVLMDELKDLEK